MASTASPSASMSGRSTRSSSPSPYVILCDAGSSGTRLYVYTVAPPQPTTGTTPPGGPNNDSHDRPNVAGDAAAAAAAVQHHHGHDVVIQTGPKMRPGLSAQDPDTVVTYLQPALAEAMTMIPPQHHASTPVYVYATAGMRLLSEETQLDLYDGLFRALRDDPAVPFDLERANFRTIGGEDEGYFAALAVNYLGGRIGSDLATLPAAPAPVPPPKRHLAMADGYDARDAQQHGGDRVDGDDGDGWDDRTLAAVDGANLLGALDLGGASAQIVFDANMSTKHRRFLESALHDDDYASALGAQALRNLGSLRGHAKKRRVGEPVSRRDFFSLSLLGYGGDRMRESVATYLARTIPRGKGGGGGRYLKKDHKKEHHHSSAASSSSSSPTVLNPCYPPGFQGPDPEDPSLTHVGTGHGTQCMKHLDAVMEETTRGECVPGQFCVDLLGGIVPPHQETFYAFTLFAYAVDFARDVLDAKKEGGKAKLSPEEAAVQRSLAVDNPTLGSMRDAIDLVCGWEYTFLAAALPDEDKIAHRCMEFALSVTLLTKFGFPEGGNRVHFTETINGREAEWTLGAYLHLVNDGDSTAGGNGQQSPTGLIGTSPGQIPGEHMFMANLIICSVFALAVGFCLRHLLRRNGGSSIGPWLNGYSALKTNGNGRPSSSSLQQPTSIAMSVLQGVKVNGKPAQKPPARSLSFPM